MVKIDFTIYGCFSTCPAWWRSFVNEVCNELSIASEEPRNGALRDALKKYNATMIESSIKDIDYLVFEEECDYLAFVLRYAG